jgi:hypothetical protein
MYEEHTIKKFSFPTLVTRVERLPIEVVQALAGNHTRLAILNLFKRFRKNLTFPSLFGKLYLFPNMPEVYIWLRVRGKVDNRILAMRKNSFIDDTQTLHYHAIADVNRFSLKSISELTKENVEALKSTFVAAGHAPLSDPCGNLPSVRDKSGNCWSKFSRAVLKAPTRKRPIFQFQVLSSLGSAV